VADGISNVKNYNLKIVKGSKNLFDEIANYIWAEKQGELLDEPDKNCLDHLMDAMRYGLEWVNIPTYERRKPQGVYVEQTYW
jgi:hypothetical protein